MKYLMLALVLTVFVSGCASPDPGTYKDSSNDRYSNSQVTGNLRSGGSLSR